MPSSRGKSPKTSELRKRCACSPSSKSVFRENILDRPVVRREREEKRNLAGNAVLETAVEEVLHLGERSPELGGEILRRDAAERAPAYALGRLREIRLRGGKRVRADVAKHLHAVLDGAEEAVAPLERLFRFGAQEAVSREALERFEGVSRADPGAAPPVDELDAPAR